MQLFLDALVVVAKHWKPIAKFVGGVTLLAVIASLVWPKTYTATAKLMPPQQSNSQLEMLAQQLGSLSSLAGDAGGDLGLRNPDDLYISMLRTRVVQDSLINRFKLNDVYSEKMQTKLRERLEGSTDIDSGKDGIIAISVRDRDPKRAADMANAYIDELSRVTRMLAEQEASDRKEYFRHQLDITSADLANAEQALKETEQRTGVLHLDMEARALIQAVANAKANLALKQVQMEGLLASKQPQHPDVIRLQREIDALRAQVNRLEGKQPAGEGGSTATLATSGLEYARRYREVKFQEALLELLFKQYETARLDQTRKNVVIQTLDPAVPPEIRSWPKRSLIVLAAFLLSLTLALVAVFGYEASVRLSQKPEVAARLALIKQYIQHRA